MGVFFWGAFGEKDSLIAEEIAKTHSVPVEVVTKFYKEMLEKIKDEVKK